LADTKTASSSTAVAIATIFFAALPLMRPEIFALQV